MRHRRHPTCAQTTNAAQPRQDVSRHLPSIVARPDIAAGRLVRVLPDWSTPRKAIYFVYPSAQSVTARLRAFIDHLALQMGEE